MSDPISSEWAELTIIRCEQSKVLIELKLGSDSSGLRRIVANPDITPFSSSVRIGGHPTGTRGPALDTLAKTPPRVDLAAVGGCCGHG